LNDYNSRTYTETLTNFERTVTNKVVNSNGDVSFTEQNYKFTYPSSFYEIPEITHLYSNPAASSMFGILISALNTLLGFVFRS
ncbi:hypothetical protein NQU35_27670, partial [Escherichia coli]|nr:hypothetical protein [Escherichia coli]